MRKTITRVILPSACTLFLFAGLIIPGDFAPEKALAKTEDGSGTSAKNIAGAEEKKKDKAEKEKPAPEKAAPTEESPSEKIIRIESGIESAKKDLAKFRAEHKTRLEEFEKTGPALKDLKDQLDRKKEEFSEIQKEPVSPDSEQMKAEIERLQNKYDLAKEHTDLALEAEKTLREQIKTLEERIERDTRRLEHLEGEDEAETKPEPSAAADPSKKKAEPAKPAPLAPMGVRAPADTEQRPDQEKKKSEFIETPEQIEAHRLAERKTREAQEAAVAIVDHVERKSALEKQITLENKMIDTAGANRENLVKQLEAREKRLSERISAKAPNRELRELQQEIVEIRAMLTKVDEELRARYDRLNDLNDEMKAIQRDEIIAVREAEKKREEAEAARDKSLWLESPFHPDNLLKWGATRGPKLIIALLAMAVMLLLVTVFSKSVSKIIMRHGLGSREAREKRVKTLESAFRGTLSGLIVVVGLLILLQEAGMDIKALLGGAAVIGLAIAFGAQSLMKDYFNGFMILLEGQYQLKDWIQIGDVSGEVERITLRVTTLRDLEGRVHFIPNGQISRVTNMTHRWAQVMLDIGVAYKEDVDRVMAVLMDIAGELQKDKSFGMFITDEPMMLGVDLFAESGVVIRMLMKTRAGMQWPVRREMLRRIKNRFDEEGIEIPVPQRVIFQRAEESKADAGPVHDQAPPNRNS